MAVEIIAKLPVEIIQHILTFLTPKEAAQARLLSKVWFIAWQTRLNLCFVEPRLHETLLLSYPRGDENVSPKERREMFLNFVNKILLNYREHNNSIHELKLKICVTCDSARFLDEWIKIAAENGLKRLEICPFGLKYTLPPIVHEAKSLEYLSISWCKLEQPVTEGVMCCSLKRLVLKFVDLSDEVFQKMISNNKFIEDLEIYLCRGLRNIKVVNLKNLKNLSVRYGGKQGVEVEAPNIESFKCDHTSYQELKPFVFRDLAYRNLKLLALSDIGSITDTFFAGLAMKFPHLVDLRVSRCRALHRLKIDSNSLRLMKLDYNEHLVELQVDAPNIVRFEYQCIIIPDVFFTRASNAWESKIGISCSNIDNAWFFRLKGLLNSLVPSKIFLEIKNIGNVSFNGYEITDYPANPGPEIGNLSLYLRRSDREIFAALLDGCFWICRPQIIQEWWISKETVGFTKFLHEVLMDSRNQDHVNFQETIKFWQKDLKEVKVISLKRTEELKPELFDWSKNWLESTGKEWQPDLECWKLNSDSVGRRLIHFTLEW